MRIHKYRAFTLVEVVVVMILITLLVNIGFVLFLNGQKLLQNYEEVNQKMVEVIQFQKQMHTDFERAELIKGSSKEIHFYTKNNGIISYEIIGNKLKIKKNNLIFDQHIFIEDIKIDYLKQFPELISRVYMSIHVRNEEVVFSFGKEYTNRVLFELLFLSSK